MEHFAIPNDLYDDMNFKVEISLIDMEFQCPTCQLLQLEELKALYAKENKT